MNKYINIFIIALIIFIVPNIVMGQTTDQNQNTACNNKANGQDCSYKVQLSGRDPETADTVGKCDRRGDGRLYCNPTLTGWEDCFPQSQAVDACKTGGKTGTCKEQGSTFFCDTTNPPNTSAVKCGTTTCAGGEVCVNQGTTPTCTASAAGTDGKCGTATCTGSQVCVSQSGTPTCTASAATGGGTLVPPSNNPSTTAGTVSYESYTNFPGVGRIKDLCQLINALWLLGFVVLLTSVLGMFLYGGYIYVTAGVNAGKVNQAKEIFTNTITGLIIGLSIFIVINIINPGLLQGNCSIPSAGSGTPGTPGDGGGGAGPLPGTGDLKNLQFGCVGDCTCAAQKSGKWAEGLDGDGQGDADKCIVDAMKYVASECPGSRVNAFNETCGHSNGSAHYSGRAVDFNDPFCGANLSSCNAKQQQVINTLKSNGYKIGTPGGVCGATFSDSAGHIHIGC